MPRLRLRLRFDQDDVRFELRRVRCGLPTTQEQTRDNNNACPIKQFFVRMLIELAASGQPPPEALSSPRPPYRQA